jgi:hypothetical protein
MVGNCCKDCHIKIFLETIDWRSPWGSISEELVDIRLWVLWLLFTFVFIRQWYDSSVLKWCNAFLVRMFFRIFIHIHTASFTTLFTPTERVSLSYYTKTRNFLILDTLDNVKSRLMFWRYEDGQKKNVLPSDEQEAVTKMFKGAFSKDAKSTSASTSSSSNKWVYVGAEAGTLIAALHLIARRTGRSTYWYCVTLSSHWYCATLYSFDTGSVPPYLVWILRIQRDLRMHNTTNLTALCVRTCMCVCAFVRRCSNSRLFSCRRRCRRERFLLVHDIIVRQGAYVCTSMRVLCMDRLCVDI